MIFILYGYWMGGGGLRPVHNLLMHFSLWTAQKWKFLKLFF